MFDSEFLIINMVLLQSQLIFLNQVLTCLTSLLPACYLVSSVSHQLSNWLNYRKNIINYWKGSPSIENGNMK